MSTITPEALKDIELTIGLGERLTLIFVFGPGYLANDGLNDIARTVADDHRVLRHRLDRSGPNLAETVASTDQPRPIVLVSGLERMTAEPRQQLLVSMNLLRDTLSKRPAVFVIWIPLDAADEFRRLCVDLFHWRTLTVFVEAPKADDRQTRHDYLVALASVPVLTQTANRRRPRPMLMTEVGERLVRISGHDTPQGIDGWLETVERGLLLGPGGAGKTTALRRFVAARASALLDDGSDGELPILIEARRLFASTFTDLRRLTQAMAPPLGDDAASWLAHRLVADRAVLLIDGIDEIPLERWVLVTAFLPRLEANPRLRIIVSTRYSGTIPNWTGWERAQILPLDPTAIVRRLQSAGIDPEPLMAALSRASATALVEHPLSLELLIALLAGGTQPDLSFTDLIQSMVDSALGGWDSHRTVTRAASRSTPNLRTYLSVLAEMMTRENVDTVSEHSALQLEDELFGPVASPGEVLETLAERSGLVERQGSEQTGAAYAFAHRAFHDHFAGVWLNEHVRDPEQYANYAADPAWQPAVTHALALLPSRQRTEAFWRIWQASNSAPPAMCWKMRSVALTGALHKADLLLRAEIVERATDAIQQARQAGQPPTLWGRVAEQLEQLEHARS